MKHLVVTNPDGSTHTYECESWTLTRGGGTVELDAAKQIHARAANGLTQPTYPPRAPYPVMVLWPVPGSALVELPGEQE